ncbi:MAG: TraB/GumN family protein [Deltaproteobacteria bacterium]|nr:TraB/GumN family protein [Deltaproteobacteria bacterium]
MDEISDVHRLRYEEKDITIIGTAHVSRKSADLVEEIIAEQKPDTVCVELCDSRYQALTQKQKWQDTDIIKIIKEKKAFFLLANLMLASIQKKIGQKLGIRPGQEMLSAIESAGKVNAHVHLADRDIRTTLSRSWRSMGLWSRFKLMMQFMASLLGVDEISEKDVEELKNQDILETVLSEIGEIQPQLKRILIDERDQYLADKIRNAPGERIVAVVGAGHVPGIKNNWEKDIDLKALEEAPKKGKLFTIFKWGIPAAIVCLIAAGFFIVGESAGAHMIKYWIIVNALLAGIGAALAFAHPITVVSAAVAAPITSLNPMIAAGWVAGLVEIFLGKPKVRDFESLPEDITSVKGFWRNKITRILMVVVFTNIGSILGTFVAIPFMVKVFA